MDEHAEICIALGAAAAANCVPCFEHYLSKAEDLKVTPRDIEKAVEIAVKVGGGAQMVMKDSIRKILKKETKQTEKCCGGASTCCE
jgi:alkylhydroperoxidase/carboxymuconolactone decarboxylase family protein YurZ